MKTKLYTSLVFCIFFFLQILEGSESTKELLDFIRNEKLFEKGTGSFEYVMKFFAKEMDNKIANLVQEGHPIPSTTKFEPAASFRKYYLQLTNTVEMVVNCEQLTEYLMEHLNLTGQYEEKIALIGLKKLIIEGQYQEKLKGKQFRIYRTAIIKSGENTYIMTREVYGDVPNNANKAYQKFWLKKINTDYMQSPYGIWDVHGLWNKDNGYASFKSNNNFKINVDLGWYCNLYLPPNEDWYILEGLMTPYDPLLISHNENVRKVLTLDYMSKILDTTFFQEFKTWDAESTSTTLNCLINTSDKNLRIKILDYLTARDLINLKVIAKIYSQIISQEYMDARKTIVREKLQYDLTPLFVRNINEYIGRAVRHPSLAYVELEFPIDLVDKIEIMTPNSQIQLRDDLSVNNDFSLVMHFMGTDDASNFEEWCDKMKELYREDSKVAMPYRLGAAREDFCLQKVYKLDRKGKDKTLNLKYKIDDQGRLRMILFGQEFEVESYFINFNKNTFGQICQLVVDTMFEEKGLQGIDTDSFLKKFEKVNGKINFKFDFNFDSFQPQKYVFDGNIQDLIIQLNHNNDLLFDWVSIAPTSKELGEDTHYEVENLRQSQFSIGTPEWKNEYFQAAKADELPWKERELQDLYRPDKNNEFFPRPGYFVQNNTPLGEDI